MAVLPGLDANDESKTMATFDFYTAVLSNVPSLAPRPDGDDGGGGGMGYGGFEGGAGGSGRQAGGGGKEEGAAQLYLPLYAGEWAGDVLSRTLTLLQNLDSGPTGQRAADQGRGGARGGEGGGTFLISVRARYVTHCQPQMMLSTE